MLSKEEIIKEIKKEDFEESIIATQTTNKEFLSSLFDGKNFKSKLLYRGSRDGFDVAKFHQLCDNKGPTLTLVKSKNEFIFGGYSSIAWVSSQNGEYKSAPGSFLFSLNKKTKHEIYQNQEKAIHLVITYGPIFGGGCDILLYSNCNQNNSSYSNFGYTYKSPYKNGSEESNCYLAGSYNFQVDDYEVFTVTLEN